MDAAHGHCKAWWDAPVAGGAPAEARTGRHAVERARCAALLDLIRPDEGNTVSRTHSHGQVGIAVGPAGTRVGIDLEREVDRDFLALSELAYSPQETGWLRELATGERRHWFYRLWTLKEAFAKALGLDLGTALATCRIAPTPLGFDSVVPTNARWSAAVFAPHPGFRMAVVSLAPVDATLAIPIEIAGVPGAGRQTAGDFLLATGR